MKKFSTPRKDKQSGKVIIVLILIYILFAFLSILIAENKLIAFLIGITSGICISVVYRYGEHIVEGNRINIDNDIASAKILIQKYKPMIFYNYLLIIAVMVIIVFLIEWLDQLYPGIDPDTIMTRYSGGTLFGILFYLISRWWWVTRASELQEDTRDNKSL
jgi:hypothetical protein